MVIKRRSWGGRAVFLEDMSPVVASGCRGGCRGEVYSNVQQRVVVLANLESTLNSGRRVVSRLEAHASLSLSCAFLCLA